MNVKNPSIIEHLAFLSVKHNVFLAELFKALVSARELGDSVCEELVVEYRGTFSDQAVFLITKANKVVVQFRVDEKFLSRKNISFESWMNTDKIRNEIAKRKPASSSVLIQDLRHGMKKVSVEAEVLEASKPLLVHTQYGNSVLLTNVWLEDETGRIRLCLWGEWAHSVVAGDTIQIKNASVSTFKRERQLRLGKNGTLNVLKSKPARQNQSITKNTIYA